MKQIKIPAVISTILTIAPTLAGLILWDHLPDQLPVHFNIHDQPDIFWPKAQAIILLPAILLVVQIILLVAIHFSMKKIALANGEKTAKTPNLMKIAIWFIPYLSIAIHTLIFIYALSGPISIGKYIPAILGVPFILLGNYLPKMPYTTGRYLTNPRFLNEKNYRTFTHIMGFSLVILGLVFLILAIFL